MRKVIEPQRQLGEQAIGAIELDANSRDDIPQILRALQYIYTTAEVRERVFALLKELRPQRGARGRADPNRGRPGMTQWRILVLGVLRLGLNIDYDRLRELANEHQRLRQMLGHGDWEHENRYELQTLKDNLRLFTPALLERINAEAIRAGHRVLKKNPDKGIEARCDSFVVETDVHFPTDINLLLDAIRKTIETCVQLSADNALGGWRQHAYHQRQFKRQYRCLQRLRHSTSKDEGKRWRKVAEIRQAYRSYLALALAHLARAEASRAQVPLDHSLRSAARLEALEGYLAHARRQIDQIRRRVLEGERIPHEEKVFSLFEPHTEWISKGKAGVAVELGLRVCIMEDGDGFILHHQVMERVGDEQVAQSMVLESQQRFPALRAMSMDKGFHSPANQRALAEHLDCVVLPKKGRRSAAERARESEAQFIALRRRHSAVESAINALEVHGLDKCPDQGLEGFKRYVGLAVLARNIHRLGAVLKQEEQAAERRRRGPYRKRAA